MSKQEATDATFADISLDSLNPSERNARQFQDNTSNPQRQTKFQELVASVREKGIIEPLVVRAVDDDCYEVIAGERRYRAAVIVAEERDIPLVDFTVPCMIRLADDAEASDLAIIENLQREDLTPFEAATAFKDYLDQFGNTPEVISELASRTGLPAHAIRRQVRMLNLPTEVLNLWGDGTITAGHVEAFTRIDDREITLKALTECVRRKLSVRELREHINGNSPDLDSGFFDKEECQACASNTSLQSGLFTETETGGKCIDPACFEKKQSAFLEINWLQSKAAEKFGTRGFRFGFRLCQEDREPFGRQEPAARCLSCDEFISAVRLSGMVISGYERTCVGSRACFEELYRPKPTEVEEPEPEELTVSDDESTEPPEKKSESTQEETDKPSGGKPDKAQEDTSSVFNASRGERFLEAYLAEELPPRVTKYSSHLQNIRLMVLALALTSPAAKTQLVAGLGSNDKVEDLATKILEIPVGDIDDQMKKLALAQLMGSGYSGTPTSVRRVVAERFGIELHKEWILTAEYLESLNKSEIIRVGEEPPVALWNDEKVQAYRQEHHQGKALMSLKKENLIDMITKSGVDLVGRVPNEILGKKK